MGWRKLEQEYEMEIAQWQAENPKDPDGWEKNKREGISFEREAEKFGRNEWKNWYNKFKKDGTI